MEIKLQLLRAYVSDFIKHRLDDMVVDSNEIVNTVAIDALSEIQKIIQDDTYSDFDAIEEIVCVFEKYQISAGVRHDF